MPGQEQDLILHAVPHRKWRFQLQRERDPRGQQHCPRYPFGRGRFPAMACETIGQHRMTGLLLRSLRSAGVPNREAQMRGGLQNRHCPPTSTRSSTSREQLLAESTASELQFPRQHQRPTRCADKEQAGLSVRKVHRGYRSLALWPPVFEDRLPLRPLTSMPQTNGVKPF